MYSYFLIFLTGHIIGDFYFQTRSTAADKCSRWGIFVKHCILYAIAVIICCMPIYDRKIIGTVAFIIISHGIIDLFKRDRLKNLLSENIFIEKWGFFIDQLLHIICMASGALYLSNMGYNITINPTINKFLSLMNTDYIKAIGFAIIILVNIKPYNIAIKEFVKNYKPEDESTGKTTAGAGAVIGTLERWIITVLCILSQYSAIGFVLTAKSIARYKRITDDPDFAEYYLMGTLLSATLAIGTYVFIRTAVI